MSKETKCIKIFLFLTFGFRKHIRIQNKKIKYILCKYILFCYLDLLHILLYILHNIRSIT